MLENSFPAFDNIIILCIVSCNLLFFNSNAISLPTTITLVFNEIYNYFLLTYYIHMTIRQEEFAMTRVRRRRRVISNKDDKNKKQVISSDFFSQNNKYTINRQIFYYTILMCKLFSHDWKRQKIIFSYAHNLLCFVVETDRKKSCEM